MYNEDNLSDSDEPDDPVEDGNVRGRDGYIYDFNTENKYRELSREEKMEHLSMFPNSKKTLKNIWKSMVTSVLNVRETFRSRM